MTYTVEIKDYNGKVIYSTQLDVELGKEGGLVRSIDAHLDEYYAEENDANEEY